MFLNLLSLLLLMLALISVVLFLIPNETLIRYMGKDSGIEGWAIAALLGSLAYIPGFIAYPLCGILLKSGIAYSVIAVFIIIGYIMEWYLKGKKFEINQP